MSDPVNTILSEAQKRIDAGRDKHGNPENCFRQIASFWTAYFGGEIKFHEQDVAIMMILLKVARGSVGGKSPADTFVDIAGYAALAHQLGVEKST